MLFVTRQELINSSGAAVKRSPIERAVFKMEESSVQCWLIGGIDPADEERLREHLSTARPCDCFDLRAVHWQEVNPSTVIIHYTRGQERLRYTLSEGKTFDIEFIF